MNRKDKRRKRFKAREHQEDARGTVKHEKHGSAVIEVPRGPRPNPRSHHKTDPPKHGRRLDSQGLARRALQAIGIEDPAPSSCREFSKLVRACNGSVAEAQRQLKENLDQFFKQAVDDYKKKTPVEPENKGAGTFTISRGKGMSDPVPYDAPSEAAQAAFEQAVARDAGQPTPAEWDEVVARAKRRKRGVGRFLEKDGFKLVHAQADPRVRESWVRST